MDKRNNLKRQKLICLVRGGCTVDRVGFDVSRWPDAFNVWYEGTMVYAECTRCGKICSSDTAVVKGHEDYKRKRHTHFPKQDKSTEGRLVDSSRRSYL